VVLASLRHTHDRDSEVAFLLHTLGQLWLAGIAVDWSGFAARERRHRLPLPTYPFERQRYWIEPTTQEDQVATQHVTLQKAEHPVLVAPDRPQPELDGAFVAPRTQVESLIGEVWRDVLGLERISVHDDFFQLGGHSLIAAQVIVRLRKAFQVELPVQSLFEAPTVADLGAHIEAIRWAAQHPREPASATPDDREEEVL
jgi:phthiocerol/phenolphthiocerol synthesis type-I polyketide synthase E